MKRKILFDWLDARFPGLWNRPGFVAGFDAAIDAAIADPIDLGPSKVLTVSKAGVDLIKEFEGCRLTAYPDPGTGGKPWTIGYGATLINGQPVTPGMRITQDIADKLLLEDIERHADDVRKYLGTAPTTQSQFDALCSFAFNVGPANLGRSTLLKKHLAGDYHGAADEFLRWNKAAGRVLKGLVRRREAERSLYLRRS